MGDAAVGLELGPPDAAVAEADPVLVQGLGDDDVVDAREMAGRRQMGDAAVAAGLLVGGRRDLDRAGEVGPEREEGLDRDDRRGEAALHVAGAAAVDAPSIHRAAERVEGPAEAGLDHVDVAVEMHAGPGPPPSRRATRFQRG